MWHLSLRVPQVAGELVLGGYFAGLAEQQAGSSGSHLPPMAHGCDARGGLLLAGSPHGHVLPPATPPWPFTGRHQHWPGSPSAPWATPSSHSPNVLSVGHGRGLFSRSVGSPVCFVAHVAFPGQQSSPDRFAVHDGVMTTVICPHAVLAGHGSGTSEMISTACMVWAATPGQVARGRSMPRPSKGNQRLLYSWTRTYRSAEGPVLTLPSAARGKENVRFFCGPERFLRR